MNFENSEKVKDLQEKITNFMNENVYESEDIYKRQVEEGGRWCIPQIMEDLKSKAKSQGLWNLFLPESNLGAGLTNTEYAPLCEIMGRSPIGAEVFNCSAPDTGNMEVLVRYGTEAQKEEWLTPLLNGEIRSSFAMTEPDVASSDASNIQGSIVREGVEFKDVTVPISNILLGEGRGFEIAQGRLGPGRIHHCMRLIGQAERALELMISRAKSRVAFGKPIAQQGVVMNAIADSRAEIEQARLLVLKTAHMMDTVGNKIARKEISMIKVVAPNMATRVIDRAIQVHGGGGVTSDFPLSYAYGYARALRLADGPDEVHNMSVAKLEMRDKN